MLVHVHLTVIDVDKD